MLINESEYLRIQAVLPILCVDCLVIYQKRCLLLLRAREPARGQYWFPGGRVFKGESIRDAAVRKARDEVNLDCTYEQVISIEETIFEQQGDMPSDIHTVNICCHLSTQLMNNITINKYHDGYMWANMEDAKYLNLHSAVFMPLSKCLQFLE
jgi:colanic acid biosynthesis protein WcaH